MCPYIDRYGVPLEYAGGLAGLRRRGGRERGWEAAHVRAGVGRVPEPSVRGGEVRC